MSYDFTTVKATVAKPADIPAITRTRKVAENPLAGHFAKSDDEKYRMEHDNNGKWITLAELPVIEASEKAPLGTVVRDAARHIRNAAANADRGSEIRTVDNEDGTATLHFRSTPRRVKKTKATESVSV